MRTCQLGTTGIDVSCVAFGAGPVPALFTSDNSHREQLAILGHAIAQGINWIDTAATYGEGRSEANLGRCLNELSATARVHLATKIRFSQEHLSNFRDHAFRSVEQSLKRLQVDQITLLQLHNSVTPKRGDLATSITVADVLGARGVLEAMQALRDAGVIKHLGLTGLGAAPELRTLIRTGAFQTIQIPFNLMNPTAGYDAPVGWDEMNFGNVLCECMSQGMGIFAIRVYAGGALVAQPPSAHTLTTKFFPLDLYQRDSRQALLLERKLPAGLSLAEAAVRFVLTHPAVHSALIGFSGIKQIDAAIAAADRGALPDSLNERLLRQINNRAEEDDDDS